MIDPKDVPPALRRSVEVYLRDAERAARMDRLLARWVSPGSLAFDVGSHVGDRVFAMRRLGARVVAVEPQPACAELLRAMHGADPDVVVVEAACARERGAIDLLVNARNPTVSTASPAFVRAAEGAPGWEDQIWSERLEVRTVTLADLVREHGVPAFVKIDVEGYEDEALASLTTPLPALSFEVTTIQREVAAACLARLAALGPYRFDLALGETHALHFGPGRELDARAMEACLRALPADANSGDVYATLEV